MIGRLALLPLVARQNGGKIELLGDQRHHEA